MFGSFMNPLLPINGILDSRPFSDHPPTGTRPACQTLYVPPEIRSGTEKGEARRRPNPTSRQPIRSDREPTTVRTKLHHPIW